MCYGFTRLPSLICCWDSALLARTTEVDFVNSSKSIFDGGVSAMAFNLVGAARFWIKRETNNKTTGCHCLQISPWTYLPVGRQRRWLGHPGVYVLHFEHHGIRRLVQSFC
jgi:hypothetical protein